MQVLTQRTSSARRQGGQLGQSLNRLGWLVQVAPANARKPCQVGDDRATQLDEQVVKGKCSVSLG